MLKVYILILKSYNRVKKLFSKIQQYLQKQQVRIILF